MSAEALAKIKEMGASFGKEPEDPFSEERARAQADQFGEGVTFLSAERIKRPDSEGIKASYGFKDIRKVKIDQNAAGAKSGGAPRQEPSLITFRLEPSSGGASVLTVVTPRPKEEESKEPAPPAGDKEIDMIRELLKGFKMSMAIEVQGTLIKTNADHVDGSTVTVFEMDLDSLLADPEKLKELAGRKPKTMAEAQALLKGVKGIKLNAAPEITIEFK
jgi:hypothetical protein